MTASSDEFREWLASNWTIAGRFVRDVTHDVNNQLGAVLAYAELLALEEGRTAELRVMVDEIAHAVQRASLLLDTLAALPSSDLSAVQSVDLSASVREALMLFDRTVDRGRVRLTVSVPDSAANVQAVHTRIMRLLVHSLRYAFDRTMSLAGPADLHVTLAPEASGYLLRIAGAALGEASDDLAEAREHAAYHGGALTIEPGVLFVTVPRETGLG